MLQKMRMKNKIDINELGTTDVHTHAGGIDLYNFFKNLDPTTQSVRDLVIKAKTNGVRRLVVFPMPTAFYFNPSLIVSNQIWVSSGLEDYPYELSNKSLLHEAKNFGGDMVLPFMAIHPTEKVTEQLIFLEAAVSSGDIYGLKWHTLATNTSPTTLIGSPFIKFLANHNLPILIHAGINPDFTHPANILELASNHPEIRVCIAHFAGFDKDIILKVKKLPNVFIDTSPFLRLCDYANKQLPQVSQRLFSTNYADPANCLIDIHQVIPQQLLWGTDEPWTAFCDSKGNPLKPYSYSDECAILNQLNNRGRSDVMKSITETNTWHFLFGK